MKFKELLNEKFHTGIHANGEYHEVYINPTPSDIQDILKEQKDEKEKGVRLGFDGDNKLYAWNVYVLHNIAEIKLGVKFLLKLDYSAKDGSFELSVVPSTKKQMEQLEAHIVDGRLHEAFPKDAKQIEKFMTAYYGDVTD